MEIVEYGKVISILGFKNVHIDNVDIFLKQIKSTAHPASAQILDAQHVAGKPHLLFAFLNALKSHQSGQAISKNLDMETLLYVSGSRQITRAIEMLGITPHTSTIALIIFALTANEVKEAENKITLLVPGSRDDTVLEVTNQEKYLNLMKTFGVTELEIKTVSGSGLSKYETLTWLIVERVSLLSTKR